MNATTENGRYKPFMDAVNQLQTVIAGVDLGRPAQTPTIYARNDPNHVHPSRADRTPDGGLFKKARVEHVTSRWPPSKSGGRGALGNKPSKDTRFSWADFLCIFEFKLKEKAKEEPAAQDKAEDGANGAFLAQYAPRLTKVPLKNNRTQARSALLATSSNSRRASARSPRRSLRTMLLRTRTTT